jgi:hypothetical protein
MDGTALANVLHVAGCLLPSHCHHPIVIIQLPLPNCHPRIAAVVFINIIAIGGGGSIIAVAIAVAINVTIAVAIAISAITFTAVIVDLHHR